MDDKTNEYEREKMYALVEKLPVEQIILKFEDLYEGL